MGAAKATELFFHTYTRNKGMNITSVAEESWLSGSQVSSSLAYGYDNFHQLTSDSRTGASPYSHTFTYDAAGNRLTQDGNTWTYNAANQLTDAPNYAETFTYSRTGAVATKGTSSGTVTYAHTFEQVLKSVAYPGSGGTTTFTWDYDGNRRRAAGANETDRYFVFDGGRVLAEYRTSDNALANAYTTGATGLVGERPWGTLLGYHTDQLGSVRFVTDATLAVRRQSVQTAFGRPVSSSGDVAPRHRYGGAQGYHAEGPYDTLVLGVRHYESRVGRFLSRDPSGPVDGPNLYAYAGSSPLVLADPTGRFAGAAVIGGALRGAGIGGGVGTVGGPVGTVVGGIAGALVGLALGLILDDVVDMVTQPTETLPPLPGTPPIAPSVPHSIPVPRTISMSRDDYGRRTRGPCNRTWYLCRNKVGTLPISPAEKAEKYRACGECWHICLSRGARLGGGTWPFDNPYCDYRTW